MAKSSALSALGICLEDYDMTPEEIAGFFGPLLHRLVPAV
jgi:hypothetical protein